MMGTCTVLSVLLPWGTGCKVWPQGLVLLPWIWGCSMDMGLLREEGWCWGWHGNGTGTLTWRFTAAHHR